MESKLLEKTSLLRLADSMILLSNSEEYLLRIITQLCGESLKVALKKRSKTEIMLIV